jgi:hypothetical protein
LYYNTSIFNVKVERIFSDAHCAFCAPVAAVGSVDNVRASKIQQRADKRVAWLVQKGAESLIKREEGGSLSLSLS